MAAATRASIRGMRAERVAATAKHFPGLGGSQVNTDDAPATVEGDLDLDLIPFEAAIAERVPLVMLSHALYPALDGDAIASQSRAIVTGLLREQLGYDGVVVTDSMEAQAVLARSGVAEPPSVPSAPGPTWCCSPARRAGTRSSRACSRRRETILASGRGSATAPRACSRQSARSSTEALERALHELAVNGACASAPLPGAVRT